MRRHTQTWRQLTKDSGGTYETWKVYGFVILMVILSFEW